MPEIGHKPRYARPHSPSLRLTMQPSTAVLTCVVVWGREVPHGVANPSRIDGQDGVAGSIPAGGATTNQQTRPGLVQLRVSCWHMMVARLHDEEPLPCRPSRRW